MVAAFAYREEVAVGEPFLKQGIDHVLCSKPQLDRAGIGIFEFGEPSAQSVGRVRDILHYVGREPHAAETHGGVGIEDFERIVERLHSVVHAEEDM